jgi:methylaspartate ammonia-lyase
VGGAVMPHALINHKTDVGAEAESLATNLSASALSTRVRSEQ